MLKFLWRLFVVGFPPKCMHDFEKWEVISVMGNDHGTKKIFQTRMCKKCGLVEGQSDTI